MPLSHNKQIYTAIVQYENHAVGLKKCTIMPIVEFCNISSYLCKRYTFKTY